MSETQRAATGAPSERGAPVRTGHAGQVERLLSRARYLAAVARSPQLAGPPMSLGRRARISFGTNGSLVRGRGLVIADGFSADIDGPVHIGDEVYLNRDVNIAVFAGLTVGSGSRFGERVSVHDEDHLPGTGDSYLVSPIRIGRGVWLGANVVVLRGVTVGDGAVVAAGAVVRSDVPAGALAAGVPARVVRSAAARGGTQRDGG